MFTKYSFNQYECELALEAHWIIENHVPIRRVYIQGLPGKSILLFLHKTGAWGFARIPSASPKLCAQSVPNAENDGQMQSAGFIQRCIEHF